MELETNRELELAFNFVENTSKNIFLTGKAGTGKTTFLKNLRLKSPKRMIVLAPTGVAAINAQGVTIHSFFQLPFGPYIPKSDTSYGELENLFTKTASKVESNGLRINRLTKEKLNIIKTLDLLVIDEISMVRADLLDAISDSLCRYRKSNKPFGGVQLLMIGDMQQLSPVVKEDDWNLLKEKYQSPFFFSSEALRRSNFVAIELEYVYRQQDRDFLKLLNFVRDGLINNEVLSNLNKRYIPNFNSDSAEGYITLCTHNHSAQKINATKLADLDTKAFSFMADVTGTFPEYMYPTDNELVLKVGAQVMFVQNDTMPTKRYYNGKIGNVKGIFNDFILVESDGVDIIVSPSEWYNMKYAIDDATKEIVERIDGTFKQYPLKCAWAITIHKSQGLTFEKALIDAENSFAHGQVYVALSRCKTLEGVVLKTPLQRNSIVRDELLSNFGSYVSENLPSEQTLDLSVKEFYTTMLIDLFKYDSFNYKFNAVYRIINSNLYTIYPKLVEVWRCAKDKIDAQLLSVGEKFAKQLNLLIYKSLAYKDDVLIKERVDKGLEYFKCKLEEIVAPLFADKMPIIDNKETKKQLKLAWDRLLEEFEIKTAAIEAFSNNNFDVSKYLKIKSDIILSERSDKKLRASSISNAKVENAIKDNNISTDVANENVFNNLIAFRLEESKAKKVPAYVVLLQKTIIEISNTLPSDIEELLKIKGIGKKKAELYGNKILKIVEQYK